MLHASMKDWIASNCKTTLIVTQDKWRGLLQETKIPSECRSHTALQVPKQAALYFASVDESGMIGYFLLLQEIALEPDVKQ